MTGRRRGKPRPLHDLVNALEPAWDVINGRWDLPRPRHRKPRH